MGLYDQAVAREQGDGAPAPGRPPQYPIESVDNALKLLLLLGERPQLRLTEVSEYLGVASSTAHRLLAMLTYRGFVRQDERTRAYQPGTALTGVAYAILQRFDFRAVLRPRLERLNHDLRETVHLGLLDGSVVRFIDAVESPRAVRVASRLGRSMPASSTSTGKAMLAELPPAELRSLYPGEALEALTEHSIRTRSQLEEQLLSVRERGYAVSSEESEEGVSSVAVAFPASRSPLRIAFNASVPSSRMTPTEERAIAAALRVGVDEAADLLHG